MYCLEIKDNSESKEKKLIKKCKRCSKYIVKGLTYEDYYQACFHRVQKLLSSNRIGQSKLEVYTLKQNKSVFTFDCNKRHWLDDGKSLAFGHYKIQTIEPPYTI